MDDLCINLPDVDSALTNPTSLSCFVESPVDEATATGEHQALFEKISSIICKEYYAMKKMQNKSFYYILNVIFPILHKTAKSAYHCPRDYYDLSRFCTFFLSFLVLPHIVAL